MSKQGITGAPVFRMSGVDSLQGQDHLAVEEPLEIRVGFTEGGRRTYKSISITMRTPNAASDDWELAAGFLFTEGIIRKREEIKRIFHIGAPLQATATRNTVRLDLHSETCVDLKRLERHFYTTSSCGVCGKTSIDALHTLACPALNSASPQLSAEVVHRLPATLRQAQSIFEQTGGLHAAALFDAEGRLLCLREDVGRHNALDKLIGAELLAGRVPLNDCVVLVSGRASFELIQKALMAGVPVLAAVGAPSSLAVELARSAGMTLLGFVRDERFNIYAGAWRIPEAGIDISAAEATNYVCVEVKR